MLHTQPLLLLRSQCLVYQKYQVGAVSADSLVGTYGCSQLLLYFAQGAQGGGPAHGIGRVVIEFADWDGKFQLFKAICLW